MNVVFRLRGKAAGFLTHLLAAGLLAGAAGIGPVMAATVNVDQTPLIIQRPLPPNIVLMLDDSGSMKANFMPDWTYLTNNSKNEAVINANNNGVYYNPKVPYTPPPTADSTAEAPKTFTSQTDITNVPVDGFAATSKRVDLTTYDGNYECNDSDSCGSSKIKFNASGDSVNYFQYSTGAAGGPYTVHYVAASSCGNLTKTSVPIDCVLASDTSGAAAPLGVAAGENIANWFAYYHTRILMAKSGLMSAFSTIDSTFRVGFGSINGNNDGNLPGFKAQYGVAKNYLAKVMPFGDGASGTQKAGFWSWVQSVKGGSSTPLRGALDAVGTYYTNSQPWQSSTTDATELACRQSYAILTTDGFWRNEEVSVGDVDGKAATLTGANGQTYSYKPALPYSDGFSNTLADVAMKYWVTDLRDKVPNEVPTSTEDPAFWQHMTTFTLGMGFAPTGITPNGTTIEQIFKWANGGAPIANFSWPKPSDNSINNIADLAHAAVNGHGGFYSAKNPKDFADGIKEALKRASERVGTGASLAANSTQLKTGTMAYQANYYTAKWKGDLKALAVDPNTGTIATTTKWTASAAMPAAASRNIWTYNTATKAKAVFKNATTTTPPVLSADQLAALGADPASQVKMINYLRGDAAQEQKSGGSFRNRDTPLGDIVNSQPVYVGAPDPNLFVKQTFTGSTSYYEFASGTVKNNGDVVPSPASTRSGMIYVAANDGMLHGFNANTGAETFAYIPGAVLTVGCSVPPTAGCGLAQLASTDYGSVSTPHQYFNDGELTVADVYTGSSASWKTVLVGTTGRGLAKAVYALDITDPANIGFLWERSAGDGKTNSNYIGQMVGKPVVAQTADGKWSVLIGNGYNSEAGVSALLQFELDDGTLHAHKTSDTTGLAAPAAWMDPPGAGVSTVAYAGDGSGNVWSFGLNTGAGTPAAATPDSDGVKIYVAKDAADKFQPITSGMLIGKDPATGNTWVFFGTGRYLSAGDLANTDTQTWYGLIVKSGASGVAVTSTMTRAANLAKRTITDEASNGRAVTTLGEAAASGTSISGKSGWYMDLVSPIAGVEGERMVTPSQFQGNMLIGTTRIPQTSDPCNPSGRGWIMALDPFTGTNPTAAFFDTNGDGRVDDGDTVNGKPAAGLGFTSLPNNPIFVGSTMLTSFDNGTTSSTATRGSTGAMRRVSWRELMAH